MAKIEQGILGGFSGRVGTVVGYQRHGQWFVRAYQPHIKDRKSAAQLRQRGRFKQMIQFASPATPVLRQGLHDMAERLRLTEGNCFLRLNSGCFDGSGVDYARLRFSQGGLAGVEITQTAVDQSGTTSVRWRSHGGRLTDRVHLYAYCAATGRGVAVAAAERGRNNTQFTLPQEFLGEEVHLWAFATSADGKASATAYAPLPYPAAATDKTNFCISKVKFHTMEEPILNAHNKEEYPPMHTAEHILNQTMVRMFGCPRSRNAHIERKKSKCDYLLDAAPSEEQVGEIERRVNEVIASGLPVSYEFVKRGEVPPEVDLWKLPDDASETLRLVRIGDYDLCACVGTHVQNTSEIGTFKIISHDYNEEAHTWRIRFKLVE